MPHHAPTTYATPRNTTQHHAPPRATAGHGICILSLFQGDEWGREEEDAHRISVKKFFHQVGWCDKSASNQSPG